jgi:hypothetical protein
MNGTTPDMNMETIITSADVIEEDQYIPENEQIKQNYNIITENEYN